MSKLRLQVAKELIQEGNKDAARDVLLTIADDETAQNWLGKLGTPTNRKSHRGQIIGAIAITAVAIASFFAGREFTKMEIANSISQIFSAIPTPNFTLPLTLPTADPNRLGGEKNPIPAGQPLATQYEIITIQTFDNPSRFNFADIYGNQSLAAVGARYVGLQIDFQCPKTEVICFSTRGDLVLLLTDGRNVPQISSDIYARNNPLDDKSIVGGANVRVWRFFEMPKDAKVQAIKLSNSYADDDVWGLMPNS